MPRKTSDWTPPWDRRRWSESDGRAMVEAFRRSGDSIRAFARRHGLDPQRVRRWVARLDGGAGTREAGEPVSFAPVRLIVPEGAEASPAAGLEVAIGGAVIRVGRDFDEELLRRVVHALAGQAC